MNQSMCAFLRPRRIVGGAARDEHPRTPKPLGDSLQNARVFGVIVNENPDNAVPLQIP